MKMKLTCLIALLAPFFVSAQQTSPAIAAVQQKLSSSFETRFKNYPQEKVYAHVSQSVFLSGQTVWYQVYSLAYGKPSDLSKIAYVRLSDEKGRLIKQDKLPLKNSIGWGNIDLPDTLKSGWYRLQAFTAWSLNFDRRDLFTQVLYIQNPHEPVNPDKFIVAAANNYRITFYPEGGKLIDGTTGNIAFKAEDGNGMPVAVHGEVMDAQNNKVAAISTVHDGMGSFSFETRVNTVYTAQVHFPDNSVQNVLLPAVENAGISMRTNPGPAGEIDLAFASVGQQQPLQDVLVQAVQDDGVAVGYPLQLSRGINVFSFNKNTFSTGIVHFGLFDGSGKLLGERSVFVDRGDLPGATLKAGTISIAAGASNALTIDLRDASGRPVQGNVSVSVSDADMGNPASDNLQTFDLLSAGTTAYIPDAGYYFKNSTDTLRSQLDLLMLTFQAHYAKWAGIIANNTVALRYPVEQSQFIAGRIEKYNPAENLKIKMMITSADSGKVMAYVEPDHNGLFKVGNFNSPGNADVLYEAVNRKNHKQDVDVTFFNEGIDTVALGPGMLKQAALGDPGINTSFIGDAVSGQLAYNQANGIMLKTVDIKQSKKTPLQTIIDRHVSRLEADVSYDFDLVHDNPPASQKILDYLNGRVPGLVMVRLENGTTWTYHGHSTLQISATGEPILMKPYYYIDEMYADEDEVEDMSMTDVALVRYLPPPVWFAPLQGGFIGAVMIYTKKPDDDFSSYGGVHAVSRLLDKYTFNGFSMAREFTANKPGNDKQKPGPGFGATIFWAHDLQTDAGGAVNIHFTANGKTKKYRVVLQGMDKDGHPVYLEKVLTAAGN